MNKTLWLPYNIFDTRRGAIALEAHLWAKLEGLLEARKVLLARRVEGLLEEAQGPCVLKQLVDPERQLEDLRRIAGARIPARPPGALTLILPWALRGSRSYPDPVELTRASALARELLSLDPRPSRRVLWLPLPIASEPKIPDAAIARIASTTPRIASYLDNAFKLCIKV